LGVTDILRFITDFGDQAVVLPLALGAAVLFAVCGWRRGALSWIAAIGCTFGLILLLKLDFAACADLESNVRPNSPSGHAASAAAVYGGLAAIMMRSAWHTRYWVLGAIAIAAFFAVVLGVSRVMLGAHSTAEVVIGGLIGTGGAVSAAVLAGVPAPAVRISRVAALGLCILFLLHGFHMPAEQSIRSVAAHMWPFPVCF